MTDFQVQFERNSCFREFKNRLQLLINELKKRRVQSVVSSDLFLRNIPGISGKQAKTRTALITLTFRPSNARMYVTYFNKGA